MNKSWEQHSINQQLYGHLPSIYKTIQVRRTKDASDYERIKDELISAVLLEPLHRDEQMLDDSLELTYCHCTDKEYSLEDPPKAMDDRAKWRGRVMEIRARGTPW